MAKPFYTDSDYQDVSHPTRIIDASADGDAIAWRQGKYSIRRDDGFTSAQLDALCTPGNDCILARYEVNVGNFTTSGSNLTDLLDLSGNGRHLRQYASPGNRPTIVASFPGGTDTNGLQFVAASQQYLRSETSPGGVAITHNIPSYSLGFLAVFTAIGTSNNAPLFSWNDPVLINDVTSPYSMRAQNGGTTQANNATSIRIGSPTGVWNAGIGPQYPVSAPTTGPQGIGVVFAPGSSPGNARVQPFFQSWGFEPYNTGADIGNLQAAYASGFPVTGKSIFMGVARTSNATNYADIRLKALIVVNLSSVVAQVEGRKDPQAFLHRVALHYMFYNSWGQQFNNAV